MSVDIQELRQVPHIAAASRIKYIRNLSDEQLVEFYKGLLLATVAAKNEGNWENVSHYLEEWEDKVVNVILLGRDSYETGPFAPLSKPLGSCKVAIVTTAGVYVNGDKPFDIATDHSFRIIPEDTAPQDFRIAHDKYDLTGVLEDINTVYPVDTLKDLAAEGIVGSVAETHYGFMGFIPKPDVLISETAPEVANRLKAAGVDAVVIPAT